MSSQNLNINKITLCLTVLFFLTPILVLVAVASNEPVLKFSKEENLGTLYYAQDVSRKITFYNPSPFLPATVTPPPKTGCTCFHIVTKQTQISPHQSAQFVVSVEPSDEGMHTEALHFTVHQGLRTKPVYIFVNYKIVRSVPTLE